MPPLLRWLLPLAVGALVLVVAALVPVPPVRGSLAVGPQPLQHVVVDHRLAVRWGPGHRAIELVVQHRSGCVPRLGGVRTIAPARLQVRLRLPAPAVCPRGPLRTTIPLPVPAVAEQGQRVVVLVGDVVLVAPRWARQGTVQ